MTVRITLVDRYVEFDKRGVVGWGRYLTGRLKIVSVEVGDG